MKFKFAFEKILEYRRSVEASARRDYNDCVAKVEAAENQVRALYDAISESRKLATTLSQGSGNNCTSLVQIDEFIRGQGTRIETQKQKVRELRAIAEEAHEVLLSAAKERKIYEKLREKRAEDFRDFQKKHELKQVDELVVTRFKTSGENV